jgi:hypothetical protein
MFSEVLQIIRRNKMFVFVWLVSLFLSYLETIPDESSWLYLFLRLANLLFGLFVRLYIIAIVLIEKGLLVSLDTPAKLAYKYIGKSLFVALVSAFWLFLILFLPYSIVNYIDNSVSGMIGQIFSATKSFVLGFMIFSTFTVGMAIFMSRKTPMPESPALGLMEVYKNFPYYFKSSLVIAIVGQLSNALLIILFLVFNVDKKIMLEQISRFPNNVAYLSSPYLFLLLMYKFSYLAINLIQRIAMVLIYTNRPKNEEKELVQDVVLKNI